MLDSDHRLSYWRKGLQVQNFGDLLSELLFDRLSASVPPLPGRGRWRGPFDVVHLIGSVIGDTAIARDLEHCRWSNEPRIAFWGCGLRENRPIRRELLDRCLFYGIRGPLSRRVLSLSDDTPVGDPGLLLPLIHDPRPAPNFAGKIVCIPHFLDGKSDAELLTMSGADVVLRPNIAAAMEAMTSTIDSIAAARLVLCGALHGAIAACAYDRPFAFFDSGYIDVPFKWRDFAASIGIDGRFVTTAGDAWAQYEQDRARIRKPSLTDLLDAAPFRVQKVQRAKALAHDRRAGTLPSRLEADPTGMSAPGGTKMYSFFRRRNPFQPHDFADTRNASAVICEDNDVLIFKIGARSDTSIFLFFDSGASEIFNPATGENIAPFQDVSKFVVMIKQRAIDVPRVADAVWPSLEAEIDLLSAKIVLGHGAGAAVALRLNAKLKADIVVAISPSALDRPLSSAGQPTLGGGTVYLLYDPKTVKLRDVASGYGDVAAVFPIAARNSGTDVLDLFPNTPALAELLTACRSSRLSEVYRLVAHHRRAFAKRALTVATAAQLRHPRTTLTIIEKHGQSFSRRETAALYLSTGERLFKTGHLPEAAHCFSSATDLFPDDGNYAFTRSVFLFHTRQLDDALIWARRAASLAPGHKHIAQHLREVEQRVSPQSA